MIDFIAKLVPASLLQQLFFAKAKQLFTPNPDTPQNGWDYAQHCHFPQEMQFAIDALAHLQPLLQEYPKQETVKLLDYGPGFGAGANLFAQLLCSNFLTTQVCVDTVDIKGFRKPLADFIFPSINYCVGDLEQYPDDHWDIVYSSNVIEHTESPAIFMERLLKKTKRYLIVLAPFEEDPLSPGHISCIDKATFAPFKPIKTHVFFSYAWAGSTQSRQILAIFDKKQKQ